MKKSIFATLALLLIFVCSSESFYARASKVEVNEDGSTDGNQDNSRGPASVESEPVEAEKEIKPSYSVKVHNASDDGEKEASRYFRKPASEAAHGSNSRAGSAASGVGAGDHYLALHVGGFLNSDSYSWGVVPHNTNPGRLTAGVTYRMASLGSLADWLIRADFLSYGFPEGNSLQLAIVPMIMIPDSGSQFPIYFGVGIGPGVFFNQVQGSSSLAFNYQLVAGVRVFDVIENTGFFVETGLKNNILLTSQGQFNGLFLSTGAIFTF